MLNAYRPDIVKTHLESVVCYGFEESIFDCLHVPGGDNCSVSVGIECSKAIGYVVISVCVCVCVCVDSGNSMHVFCVLSCCMHVHVPSLCLRYIMPWQLEEEC